MEVEVEAVEAKVVEVEMVLVWGWCGVVEVVEVEMVRVWGWCGVVVAGKAKALHQRSLRAPPGLPAGLPTSRRRRHSRSRLERCSSQRDSRSLRRSNPCGRRCE